MQNIHQNQAIQFISLVFLYLVNKKLHILRKTASFYNFSKGKNLRKAIDSLFAVVIYIKLI